MQDATPLSDAELAQALHAQLNADIDADDLEKRVLAMVRDTSSKFITATLDAQRAPPASTEGLPGAMHLG